MDERFGFIHEKLDIKVLILFVLRRLPIPISLETMAEITLCDDGISYFDFADCVAELVDTEHISFDGIGYMITAKGIRNGEITESGIPYSVRLKADKASARLRKELLREQMIDTSHVIRRDGGYTVSLSLSDGVSEIISMELFAANETQAVALKEGFHNNAERVYNEIIKLILE